MSVTQCIPESSRRQPVRLPNGRISGTIEGDTFTKKVIGSKHQLRQPPGWGIDAQVFDDVIKPQVRKMRIVDRESGREYRITVEEFSRHSFVIDRGYGRQYACPLQYFTVQGDGHMQLSLWGDSLS